jgi:hypothetical protein
MNQATIFQLHGRFQPSLNVQKYPSAIRVLPYRPHQKPMVDTVKEALDIQIQDPIVSPAPLSSGPHGLDCRLAGSVPIRVRMKVLFQDRLKIPFGYRLGNAVGYRWNPQRPRPPIVLRYIHPTHGRWKIAARGHPIPDLKEIILQILFKLCKGLPIYPSCSLVPLNPFVRLPHLPFGNTKRLCLIHKAPPIAG